MKQITHVAIVYNDTIYCLEKPNRHHDIIRIIGDISGPDIQGFLDEDLNFLTRKEAFKVAKENGQFLRSLEGYQGDELFSEDIW